jgi:hypothetical protein
MRIPARVLRAPGAMTYTPGAFRTTVTDTYHPIRAREGEEA